MRIIKKNLMSKYQKFINKCDLYFNKSKYNKLPSDNINWKKINYNRVALINFIISLENRKDAKYLEIGCGLNETFRSVPLEHKYGVDNARGGTHRMTSDSFFEKNVDLFDYIFIDGLHTYQQARNDFINSVKFIKDKGWIIFHDMYPRNYLEQKVPRVVDTWTGDVWKLAFQISKVSDFKLIKIDHGLGVIYNPKNIILNKDDYNYYLNKDYNYFVDNSKELNLLNFKEFKEYANSK